MKKRGLIDPDTIVFLKKIGQGCLVLILLGLLILAVWHGTRLERMTINAVTVSGGETISHDVVRTIAEGELEGSYLGLIPRRFSLTYPKQDIESAVSEVERIYGVRTWRENQRTLRVDFKEYIPFALWCGTEDGSQCFFIDQTGLAFGVAPDLRGGSLIRYSQLGIEPERDNRYLTKEKFNTLQTLVDLLSDQGWFIHQIIVDQVDDTSLFVGGGSELKIALADDPMTIIDNLQTVLATEEFVDLAPGNFAYIDLRFGNKVYVNVDGVPELELDSGTTSTSTVAE